MYAQVTSIHVPLNKIAQLREIIETDYLPVVRERAGFLAGYLLEQVDDPDTAQLILFWDSHASVESFNRTGMLQASVAGLAADIPGIEIQRNGYVVQVAERNIRELVGVG